MPVRRRNNNNSAAVSKSAHFAAPAPHMDHGRCDGCGKLIFDQFVMTVNGLEREWHGDCLRCCHCNCLLQGKCFTRNGKFFCRTDYYSLFGSKCSGCGLGIPPDDLVRHTPRGGVYHLKCFICAICRKQLTTGEQLHIISDSEFICEEDFINKHKTVAEVNPVKTDITSSSPSPPYPTSLHGETAADLERDERLSTTGASELSNGVICGSNNNNMLRIEDDEEDEEMKLSETGSQRCGLGPADRECDKDAKSVGDNSSVDESEPRNDENNISTKRRGPRTTIKAKQLELLRNAFSQTPKPTRHIREQLAQETGLTMRVIQVWFQNRRSKERRLKQMTAMGSGRRNMLRPRRPGAVRSMRDFDGDSGDLISGNGVIGPGFPYFSDGSGNHPADFFPPPPHGPAGVHAGHPHPGPGMFEFHHFPPRHAQNSGPDGLQHFSELSSNGHGIQGPMSHIMESNFGAEMLSQNSTPNSLTPDIYRHSGFEGIGKAGEMPAWQSMAMAQ